MKKILNFTSFVITLVTLMGCLNQKPPATESVSTATQTLISQITTETSHPSPTKTSIVTLTLTPEPLDSEHPVVQVEANCGTDEITALENIDILRGLVISGEWDGRRGFAVLADKGVQSPDFVFAIPGGIDPFFDYRSDSLIFPVLYNGNEIEFHIFTTSTWANNEPVIKATLVSPYAPILWVSAGKIVIPQLPEKDNFMWDIYNYSDDSRETIAITIKDVEETLTKYGILPQIEVENLLAVYLCATCSDVSYTLKDLRTNTEISTFQLGTNHASPYRGTPIWSPDGRYIAVMGGNDFILNRFYIFDDRGEKIKDYSLPDVGGTVSAVDLSWSPDSQYIAFIRREPRNELSVERLTIFNLREDRFTDICLPEDFIISRFLWSPDGSKILIEGSYDAESEAPLQWIISDLNSGDKYQVDLGAGFRPIIWIK